MCDEFTAEADAAKLAERGLSRRDFAALSAAAISTLSVGVANAAEGDRPAVVETAVAIPTPDGAMDGFLFHPAQGKHAAVILWPDIGGVRDANKLMARSLADQGYAVLVVNPYYRSMKGQLVASISELFAPGARERLNVNAMIAQITPAGIASDAKAIVAWLDSQPAVDTARKIGVEGYCMTGSYTVRCAHAVPERIGAACSFHGGNLVTEAADSPHRLLDGSKASYLFAVARNDDQKNPAERQGLIATVTEKQVDAKVELFEADHGWMVPDAAAYDREQAERGRALSLDLYRRL